MEKQKNKKNKIVICIRNSFCTLLVIYFGILIYFINNFYFDSTSSCIDVLGEIVEEVDKEMSPEIKIYTLELKERGDNREQIKAADIGLRYNLDWNRKNLKDKQNTFEWFFALFDTKNSKTTEVVTYDEELLKKCFNNLSCFDINNIIEPQNPSFQYTDSGYVIVDEVYGNKINKDILYNHVVKAILNGETIIDLELINCYENPQYTSKSQEVIETKDILNKYITSTITYTFGNHTE